MAEGADVKAELEEMKKKVAEMEEMRRKMADMDRKHREELMEVEQKRKQQDEILLQMMDNVTASNAQMTKMEAEMQKMKVGGTAKKTTPENTTKPVFSAPQLPAQPQHSPQFLPQMTGFNLSFRNGDYKPDFTWKVDQVSTTLKRPNDKAMSQLFTWNNYLIQTKARIELNAFDDQILLSLLAEETTMNIRPIPTIYYVLKDRSGDLQHRVRVATPMLHTKFNDWLAYPVALTHKAWLTHQLYNADDSVTIEIYVEPPTMAKMVYSNDGVLNWTIENYSKRKEMAAKELVLYDEGPYFYTGPKGYRVGVRMWLNGREGFKGHGLTAGIVFLSGQFDDGLSMTFKHQTTITLFNRKNPQQNIAKTGKKNISTSKSYFVDMCDNQEILKMLHDDALSYNVTIETLKK